MENLRKGLISVSPGEVEVLKLCDAAEEKAKQCLPAVPNSSNGLRKPFTPVPEALMEVAQNAQDAEYYRRWIADGMRLRAYGMIHADGRQKIASADGSVQGYLPASTSGAFGDCQATSEQDVYVETPQQANNMAEAVIPLDVKDQYIEPAIGSNVEKERKESNLTREELKKIAALLKENSQKDCAKKRLPDDICIEVEDGVLSIPECGIAIQLVEIQELHTDDGKKLSVVYILLVMTCCSQQKMEVPGESLISLEWLKKASDGLLYLDAKAAEKIKKELLAYIRKRANEKRIIKYESGGWKNVKGSLKYVLARGGVGISDYPIIGNEKYKFPPLVQANEAQIFHKIMEMTSICQNQYIMLILMLYVQLTFLSTIFIQAGVAIKFIVTLVGETNSRKTSLALLLAKVFESAEKLPDATFTATLGGIEKAAYECGDCCMVLDDMKPGATKVENREMEKIGTRNPPIW